MNGYVFPSKAIELTYQTGAVPSGVEETTVKLQSAYIEEIRTVTGGSKVFVGNNFRFGTDNFALVTETPAEVAALTGCHILLTPLDTDNPARYIPIGRLAPQPFTDETAYGRTGTKVRFLRDNDPRQLIVSETVATLIARIAAAVESAGKTTGTLVATGSAVGDAALIVDDFTIATSTGAGQGVVLPPCVEGDEKVIFNNGPDAITLYADGTDTINGVASISLAAGSSVQVHCFSGGAWRSYGTYFSESFHNQIYSLDRTLSFTLDGNKVDTPLPFQTGNYETIPFEYDFSVSGGAVSTINLEARIPDNTSVIYGIYDVVTAVTGGAGSTIAFGVNTNDATGLLAATAIGTAGTLGLHDLVPDWTAANATTKTTAERTVDIVIGTDPLTAGKIRGQLYCLVTE